ncbi:MAG: hypothetical protein QXP98_06605 [Thermoproteus sp.]
MISIQQVLDKLRAAASSRGRDCTPDLEVQLSEDLFLSGAAIAVKTKDGFKCLEANALSDALKMLAYPRTIEQGTFKTLRPPYVELYYDDRKYVVLGVYEGKVYMTEWSGIRLCCSWVVDINIEDYRKAYETLASFLSAT